MKTKLLTLVTLTLLATFSPRALTPWGQAAMRTVTTTNDTGAGSLRQAITDAVSGDTINIAVTGTIVLTNGALSLCKNLTIAGPGATSLTLSGNNTNRVLYVCTNITVVLSNLTLAYGYGTNGGGIYNNGGNLVLLNCTLSTNQAVGARGYWQDQSTPIPAQSAYGGAIYNLGVVAATNCLFLGNSANGGAGTTNAMPQAGVGNGAPGGGGAVFNATNALFQADQTTFRQNRAQGGSGGPVNNFSGGGLPAGGDAQGGAILNQGQLNLYSPTLATNQAVAGTGSYWYGSPPTIYQGSGGIASGGAICQAGASLLITNGTIAGNKATGGEAVPAFGGALSLQAGTVTVNGTSLSNNEATATSPGYGSSTSGLSSSLTGFGGAIYTRTSLTATNDTFNQNSAKGAALIFPPATSAAAGGGGGLFNDVSGLCQIARCTFAANTASGGWGGPAGYSTTVGGAGMGGGIANAGRLLLWNVTLVTNQAIGGNGYNDHGSPQGIGGSGGSAYGGGVRSTTGAFLSLTNCTLAGNTAVGGTAGTGQYGNGSAGSACGGGIGLDGGTNTLKNSIVAYSTSGSNIWGTITDAGNNLSSDSTGGFTAGTSHLNTDPLLGPVGCYGGLTPCVPLLYNSTAINAAETAAAPATDQRGFSRFGSAADIGVYEWGAAPPTKPQFTGIRQPAANRIELQFSGEIGRRFEIHASSNLTQWSWLASLTNTTGPMLYTDTGATNPGKRFYKAIQLQ